MTSGTSNPVSLKRGVKRKRKIGPAASAEGKKNLMDTQNTSGSNFDTDTDTGSDSGNESQKGHVAPKESEVLSHAAQRKLKKRARKEAEQPTSNLPDNSNKKLPSRQNSIWVGNLSFKTTEEALQAFFRRGVPGCVVTRINLPIKTGPGGGGRGTRGENRGFAYVDFTTQEDKGKAIALSEQHLDGRKLLIKDGDDFTGRPSAAEGTVTGRSEPVSGVTTSTVGKSKTAQRILAAQKQPPAPTLFLGNLGFQATEQSIREMIEKHTASRQKDVKEAKNADPMGNKKVLKKVRMGTFEDSGLCKGFAFVDFATVEDATSVLLDPRNYHLDGRKLVVEYASADAVRRGGGPVAKESSNKQGGRQKGKDGSRRAQVPGDGDAKPEGRLETGYKEIAGESVDEPPPKRKKLEEARQREDRRGKTIRPRPGAALALAQREKVAIVPSSGKKIVF